jgi:hypothetical protein
VALYDLHLIWINSILFFSNVLFGLILIEVFWFVSFFIFNSESLETVLGHGIFLHGCGCIHLEMLLNKGIQGLQYLEMVVPISG